MKALDKIYVREFNEGINQMWSSVKATETTAIAQHEYIRKDALLEWAKENHKRMVEVHSDYTKIYDEYFRGLIEKIESL